MVVIDTQLARGASNDGVTFHDRGGPYGLTKLAKRVVAIEVTPVTAVVMPASTHENRASDKVLEHLTQQGVTDRLVLALGDLGVTAAAARALGRSGDVDFQRVGWDDKQPVVHPIRNDRPWVASGAPRRLAKAV
jgi:putative transposase